MKDIKQLCNEFQDFCIRNNFPFISADELLSEETLFKTDSQKEYLKNFLIDWENAIETEFNNL
jgi:hypothetical protein